MNDSVLENALRLSRAGRLREAADLYLQILKSQPDHFDALHALGILRYQSGQIDEAEKLIGQAVAVKPRASEAIYNRACLLGKLGRADEALACFTQAIVIKPDYIEALVNRGGMLMNLKRFEEALSDLETVTAIVPNFAEAWNNRGAALMQLRRYDEARSSYDKAIALKPAYAEAWKNRGIVKLAQNLYQQAAADFDKALGLDPRSAENWENRGNALSPINPSEAVESYSRALNIRRDHVPTLFRRGNTFIVLRRFDDAAADYRRVVEIDPDYPYAHGNLAFCRLSCCDWQELERDKSLLQAKVREAKPLLPPFVGIALIPSPEDMLFAARTWAERECPMSATPLWRGERYRHDRIRLAYLSANFNEHAVARLMAGVFEHHDKDCFETVGISFGRSEDELGKRVTRAFDRFIDIRDKGDFETAKLLRDMEVDIAVDLMGFTEMCRPGILASRPSPVQVNYLGFPGTMGSRHLDYIIADRVVIEAGEEKCYEEKVVLLPDCYLPNDAERPIAARIPSRREAGLPEAGFVFCSFNQTYKFAPGMFDSWMRLLRRIDDSVLWLSQCNPRAVENLRKEAEIRGVAGERLIFAPFAQAAEDHLARLTLADLFLDTSPYNAHTSACDALWAGVPVLTCRGTSFAGRVAASVLSAIGMPELISASFEAYENIAARLASDASLLKAVKEKVARNRSDHPLFATGQFTRNLESAYMLMHRRFLNGQEPESFAVSRQAEQP